jgi:DNA-binding NarL/FixJ family response regulator
MSLRYWPHDKLPPERARAALGAARFAAAREAGAALSLDGAIVVAVELAREMSRADSVRPVGRGGGLTARERDVLRLLVDGLTDKEIAAALAIGSRTVSNHVATIRDKLNAPSRTAAATIAIRDELI